MNLFLLRHGQTQWNAEHKVMGRKDVPLDETGERQIQLIAPYFDAVHLDEICSSPQLRALQTAQAVALRKSQSVQMDPRLSELDFRRWEGKVLDEIKDDPVYIQRREDPENFHHAEVESFSQVRDRVMDWLSERESSDKSVLLVSHADPIRILIHSLMGGKPDQLRQYRVFNCAVTALTNGSGFWELLVLNHRPGLDLSNSI
ncbi:MAG: histidine phosphatase family protein [Bdellovibrionota bacterium]